MIAGRGKVSFEFKDDCLLMYISGGNTIVTLDIEDYDFVKDSGWSKTVDNYIRNPKGEKLHRLLMNATTRDETVMFMDGDKLNMRRSNLQLIVKEYDTSREHKTKKCSCCGEIKPLSEFYVHRYHKDGHTCACKECTQHQQKNPTPLRENKFRFEGDICYIELNDGSEVFIDAEDYDKVKDRRWHAYKGGGEDSGRWTYARATYNGKNIKLHRMLLDAKPDETVDHINRNTRDNRRCNLRVITSQGNIVNSSKRSNTTSKYKGVHWHKRDRVWAATIGYEYKCLHLGYFDSEEEAAKAYNEKAIELYGEYAVLNKI